MKISGRLFWLICLTIIISASCKKDNPDQQAGVLQLASVKIGTVTLSLQQSTNNVPTDQEIFIRFNGKLNTSSVPSGITLKKADNTNVAFSVTYQDDAYTAVLATSQPLDNSADYVLRITSGVTGSQGETFPGVEYSFKTIAGQLIIQDIKLNGADFRSPTILKNIDPETINIQVTFSHALDPANYKSYFSMVGSGGLSLSLSGDAKIVTVTNNVALNHYSRYYFTIYSTLKAKNGFPFNGFNNSFFTKLDSTLKFPLISDEELLTLVQRQTFKYFYDFAHPSCGLARERNTSGDIVTTGGSGFGVMALIVGMEHGFITRSEGLTRTGKILSFLETCDRFHGAWPHWINGSTGKVVPFSTKDNGGDLVETAFMTQGLLTMRQYLNPGDAGENALINRITNLYNGIEWDWYTRGGQNVLYWHWSPNYGWDMNFQLQGYNETLITYVMAAASPTHTIPATAYHQGYARSGDIRNGKSFYGYTLPVGYDFGGPLFFAHYSFLGLDPRNLSDDYANYWTQNVNHSLINWAYCADNPKNYINYSAYCWGLTAGDIPSGYGVSEPTNDRGVITPTAAVSSLPYSPQQSMDAIRFFYYILGDKLWGEYGFHDAFDVTSDWWASSYIAIDQGPEIVMIENYRTQLPWNLFMSAPEIQAGLTKLGFSYK
jgi:hypothetical protein